jgi:molecular chaperone GrpE (heat shock protein)
VLTACCRIRSATQRHPITRQAEVRNIQMRADREVSNAHKFGVEKFANGLLEVVDNLERAMSALILKMKAKKA